MTARPAINIQDLHLSFGGTTVLDHFSLTIAPGEKIRLTAPSGGGKTSVLRCCFGLLRPQQGTIHIEGTTMGPTTVWSLRQRMSVLAQEPELGLGRVSDIVTQPFTFKANRTLPRSRETFEGLFQRLRLPPDTWTRQLAELSAGEKQRVALALTLLLKRPILLLDEPVSALDRDAAEAVLQLVRDDYEGTVVAALHHADGFDLQGRCIELPAGSAP